MRISRPGAQKRCKHTSQNFASLSLLINHCETCLGPLKMQKGGICKLQNMYVVVDYYIRLMHA